VEDLRDTRGGAREPIEIADVADEQAESVSIPPPQPVDVALDTTATEIVEITTSRPSPRSRSARLVPMKPAPPVISTALIP
jgi:hypothetical protein